MWVLDNTTPFSAERGFARDRDGTEVLIIAVKQTFAIAPDGAWSLAPEQEPVHRTPKYRGEPGRSSLRYEADMILPKPTTDMLLHGTAHAPGGVPAAQVLVTLSVGVIRKTLKVTGSRSWSEVPRGRPQLTEPEPFVQMPIDYEHALGGTDPRADRCDPQNPVGRGFVVSGDAVIGTAAPNVEHVDGAKATQPAGFGPVARDWTPRRERAGTYDGAWMEQRRPLVPADFDDRFHQAAPDDQQPPVHLLGNEIVELVNLTPEGRWTFQLPRVPCACTLRFRRSREHHAFKLQTVVIEPDVRRVLMTWHMGLPCHYRSYDLKSCHIFLKERRPLGERTPSPIQLPGYRSPGGSGA